VKRSSRGVDASTRQSPGRANAARRHNCAPPRQAAQALAAAQRPASSAPRGWRAPAQPRAVSERGAAHNGVTTHQKLGHRAALLRPLVSRSAARLLAGGVHAGTAAFWEGRQKGIADRRSASHVWPGDSCVCFRNSIDIAQKGSANGRLTPPWRRRAAAAAQAPWAPRHGARAPPRAQLARSSGSAAPRQTTAPLRGPVEREMRERALYSARTRVTSRRDARLDVRVCAAAQAGVLLVLDGILGRKRRRIRPTLATVVARSSSAAPGAAGRP
jgi:hypothetical protein